jgi:hypothetical protein
LQDLQLAGCGSSASQKFAIYLEHDGTDPLSDEDIRDFFFRIARRM